MLILDIFLIIAKMFKEMNVFNNTNVNFLIASFVKELTSIKKFLSIKKLSTKSLIVYSNRRITLRNIVRSIIYSTNQKRKLIN